MTMIDLIFLCLSVVTSSVDASDDNIFFLHTSMESELSLIGSCAVESAARSNPKSKITLYSNNWTTSSIQYMPPNVRIQRLNPSAIFDKVPIMNKWYRNINRWRKGFPLNNLSNALRLAILLINGGTYLDTDMVVVKPISEAPKNSVGVEVEEGELDQIIHGAGNFTINTAGLLNFEKNNSFVQQLVQNFVKEFNGELWGHNGPALLTRTWQKYIHKSMDQNVERSKHVNLMPKKYLYPVGWYEIDQFFDDINLRESIVRTVSDSSFTVHMWQSLLVGHIQYASENSVLSHLFEFACPTTHANLFQTTRSPLQRMMPYTLSQFSASACTSSVVCNVTLSIRHPRVGTQYRSTDEINLEFYLGVEETDMNAYSMLADDPGRLDVCTSMNKDPFTPWCVPLSAVSQGASSILIPKHVMYPGQHTIFLLLVDRQTHEISAPAATTFNVAFRQWKLKTQGGSKFWDTLRALDAAEKTIDNIDVGIDDDDDDVIHILLVHDGTAKKKIDMPAYNFIDRGLLEAVQQEKKQRTITNLRIHGPYGPYHDSLYNVGNTLKTNIEKKWGDVLQFSAIIYLPPPWPEDATSIFPSQVHELEHPLTIFRQAETSDTRLAIQRMNILGGSILLGTYAHQLSALSEAWMEEDATNYMKNIMLGHLPHVANPDVFETLQNDDDDRDIDVLLTGSLNGHTYSARSKWANVLLSTPTTMNTVILQHPGYVIKNYKDAALQLKHYASMLKRAKIIIVTPSKYGLGLAKYVEAQMAGAMIVGSGTMPYERQSYFQSFVVNMDVMNTPSHKLIEQLQWWVSNPEERHRKARIGFVHALRQTWRHWLGWLRNAVVEYKRNGRRGYWSPLTHFGGAPSLSELNMLPLRSSLSAPQTHNKKNDNNKQSNHYCRRSASSTFPLNVKVGTIGCVETDQIELFFPSTWSTVPLNVHNINTEWVDTTWACNPLPSTIHFFSFRFLLPHNKTLLAIPSFASVGSVNMFPNVWDATNNKRNFCLHLRAMFPTTLDTFFMPCYVLDDTSHKHELIQTIKGTKGTTNDLLFLLKPSEGSGGRGIRFLTLNMLTKILNSNKDANDYEYAQIYLPNPMLLESTNRRKFDYRVYALVTSFSPVPMFWLHKDGFARLSTAPYRTPNEHNIDDTSMVPHITNVHYQRNRPSYTTPSNQMDDCSQDTRSLRCMFAAIKQERGLSVQSMRKQLQNVVSKSLLASMMPLTNNRTTFCEQCYQLFGIDVLIKEDGHPFVVELNSSPSIELNNPLADGNILKKVYRDTWHMKLERRDNSLSSSGHIKEWMLSSSSVAKLKNRVEEQILINVVDQWCNRGDFDLALPPLDDFEVANALQQSEWRILRAFDNLLNVYEESNLCTGRY